MSQDFYSWITLNKAQFFFNADYIKKQIGVQVKLGAVIKSNAYGHGLLHIAQLCQESRSIDVLIVFSLHDALLLREKGILKPLILMGILDAPLQEVSEKNIDLVVHNRFFAERLIIYAQQHQQKFRVHIKVDTGMNRLGFSPDELPNIIYLLKQSLYISIVGVCSHFAESENVDTAFTLLQLQRFDCLFSQLNDLEYIHISNTAGTLNFLNAHHSLVRCGGGLYGLDVPDKKLSLKPILSLKTKIIEIREVRPQCSVGYNRTFVANSMRKIAIVPLGYYDGLDRRLSNRGFMNIKGKVVPIIGRVAMNLTTLDVTDIPQVNIHDEVLVLGDGDLVTPAQYAHLLNTIEYEITARLNPLIKRILIER
ncbi:TPA: alanine racemase [Candidatus Dependentiae bacterium]|nr:MAG: alanine racemase [candidate division TM6 bacterium GW2011_GWF2_36_131]KKQ03809.1 MAG: alanine racemase [candidate division TM6 bacterium GW2011_GWE2_36_25]KKQ19955.1 MAG: alanine racemase [candidate division TM6 bacterium GW2011_GWA2_36_9]HBR70577.1 alanine racemase [Candidatus Dependentiae bacterium]HCU00707.1 alanine racemase [Candidatus Dependentiae bacterium]